MPFWEKGTKPVTPGSRQGRAEPHIVLINFGPGWVGPNPTLYIIT